MANTTKNTISNLTQFKKGEYSEIQRKGTEASKGRRRQLNEIKEWAEQNLFREVESKDKTKKYPLYELLFKKLEQLSLQGNGSKEAIKMLFDYSGLKPVEKVENVNPQIQKIFVTKKDNNEADKLIDEMIKQ